MVELETAVDFESEMEAGGKISVTAAKLNFAGAGTFIDLPWPPNTDNKRRFSTASVFGIRKRAATDWRCGSVI